MICRMPEKYFDLTFLCTTCICVFCSLNIYICPSVCAYLPQPLFTLITALLHHPYLSVSPQVSEELNEVWRRRTGSLSDNDMMDLDHHTMFDAHRNRRHNDDDDDDDADDADEEEEEEEEDVEADSEAEDADL